MQEPRSLHQSIRPYKRGPGHYFGIIAAALVTGVIVYAVIDLATLRSRDERPTSFPTTQVDVLVAPAPSNTLDLAREYELIQFTDEEDAHGLCFDGVYRRVSPSLLECYGP